MTGNSGTMVGKLDEYYRQQRISATAFDYINYSKCSAGCAAQKFVTTREAFLGAEYEKGTLPRLLFISLDPADDWPGPKPEQRTLKAMRDSEPTPCDPGIKGRHWYETHELANRILEPIAKAKLGQSIPFEEVCRYFAHTNSAKCKNLSMGTQQGKSVLFENCRQFIPEEVEILRPDIIVTQGMWARMALAGAFPVLRQERIPHESDYQYQVVKLGNQMAIKFDTAHPRAARFFWTEKKIAYPLYIEAARRFLLEEGGACIM
jgi:hypothetical protein